MATGESQIVRRFIERTPRSRALAEAAKRAIAGGVTHDARQIEPYAHFVNRARGSRKWDVDGHEYVDYSGGHGALLLGHNHPGVTAAVGRQLERGTHYGACHELEVRWAEVVQRLIPTAERVRFTSSGTEATLLALRLARAFTGRRKIVRFIGHFHGWHDHAAFGVNSHFDGTVTPGVLPQIAEETLLATAGDIDALRRLCDGRQDIAAVILEPTGGSWGQTPLAREFLLALREFTAEKQIVLIFDEVISGFRCCPGGAQTALGVYPELTTLAKIMAGGLPGGAVAGRADIMGRLGFAGAGAAEKVPHQGTFNANPLSAAAGIAALEIVAETDACQRANDYAARLRGHLNEVLAAERVNWAVYGSYSGFHIFTNPAGLSVTPADIEAGKYDYRVLKAPPRPGLLNLLRLGMLNHGVEIFAWPGGPTSAVHTDQDLSATVDAFRETLRDLKAEAQIPQ